MGAGSHAKTYATAGLATQVVLFDFCLKSSTHRYRGSVKLERQSTVLHDKLVSVAAIHRHSLVRRWFQCAMQSSQLSSSNYNWPHRAL